MIKSTENSIEFRPFTLKRRSTTNTEEEERGDEKVKGREMDEGGWRERPRSFGGNSQEAEDSRPQAVTVRYSKRRTGKGSLPQHQGDKNTINEVASEKDSRRQSL